MVYSPSELIPWRGIVPASRRVPCRGLRDDHSHRRLSAPGGQGGGVENLLLYTAFKIVTPALRFLLSSPDHGIDGFILPGHVSVIIGPEAYEFLEEPGGRPGVITGFESDRHAPGNTFPGQADPEERETGRERLPSRRQAGRQRAAPAPSWRRAWSRGTTYGAGWESFPAALWDCGPSSPRWTRKSASQFPRRATRKRPDACAPA